jgi:glycosyltransferase involved in cell wall biosynthesis
MDLSIVIPARNELFLARTVQDIVENRRGKTEVIVVADGYWPDPVIEDYPDVHLVHYAKSIGQRAATNAGARLSNAKFIMKADGHCAFDEGFDVKLMADCEYTWTAVPRMYNLHVFNWVCNKCGESRYMGPKEFKCVKCSKDKPHADWKMEMVWQPRWSRKSDYMRFDSDLKFQYWGSFADREEAKGDVTDQMACVGACWMMHRERYWELGGMDERHGSWGQMGVEVSCKTWLSGGRQVVNKKTWFAHLFRTQDGFSFPYPNPGIEKARKHSREMWFGNKWEGQKLPLSWLIKKFWPIPGWDKIPTDPVPPEERKAMSKGLVYYTDNRAKPEIRDLVTTHLTHVAKGKEIISVSLAPISFGKNIVLDRQRGILSMFKQILAGIEASSADIIYLIEHDVLYHPSHFDFIPPQKDVYYYNEHTYKVDWTTGQAVFYYTKQTSGLCAYRELLLGHYQRRVAKVEQNARDLIAAGQPVKNDGFSRHMGFEPGCHSYPRGVDNYRAERWMSEYPNVDIRHDKNLTANRWSQDLFRDKSACQGWKLVDEVPGWGVTKGRMPDFVKEIEVKLWQSK